MRSARRSLLLPALLAAAATAASAAAAPASAQSARSAAARSAPEASIEIPFERFTLPNGLTLLVHEDRKAPIVAVNIWYHVGSKNEKEGRTGFAHLFEHLMFNGTENYDDDYFGPLEKVGATDLNGTTNNDRTNYFQNVPTPALDLALYMESERMGHLLGVVSQEKLDEQRGVVQNEKRQSENEPYGKVDELIAESTYPAGHPYSWEVIGYMEDLQAATLEDVKEWFASYYGAANAVIVVAGDVDAQTAKRKVETYFGDIPAGPPVAKQQSWIAKMSGSRRARMEDRVPQARIYKVWNVPPTGDAETDALDLVADVLASGKTSRLYERLVFDEQLATDVNAYVYGRELGSQFYIQATVRPGGDLAAVERAIDEELAKLLREGPTAAEVQRVKTQFRANFVRGIERIGGFGGKSDILASNLVYRGDPAAYKTTLQRNAAATPAQLRAAAVKWLSDGVFTLEVHPFPQYATVASSLDRTKMPAVAAPAPPDFPAVEQATLSNGLRVVLARRDAVPLVNLRLLVDAGYAADQFGAPGTAKLAMDMLDEGTTTRDALEIAAELGRLGSTLSTGSNVDMSFVNMSALQEQLDPSLALFADVVLRPAFAAADFERLQKQQLAAIRREKVTPIQIALRVFPALLYGQGHAYANPLTGSGTEEAVQGLAREDLRKFHATWFKPNNATLVVTGATSMAELRPKLERAFRGWSRADVPAKNISTVAQKPSSQVYLIDRPGSQQSIIFAGNVAAPKGAPNEVAITTMNDILGGSFTSRVNMNLREDKGWSYGSFTLLFDTKGQRPFIAYAPVQTDKTKESLQEVVKELRGIVGDRPAMPEELAKAQANLTLSLPGQWETNGAVALSLSELVTFGMPLDYYDRYAQMVRALTVPEVNAAAKDVVHPNQLVWVVVGDRSKIEAGIRELNLGDVHLLDPDGRPLASATP
ncbi:MAG TPA: pitrilysin family protein [Gemmatimonadaceae bacterium]